MNAPQPNLLQMVRAPFFSSILAPLFAGTFLAVSINRQLDIVGFLLVTLMGLALHAATNVYNDIYDTLQGTDRVNRHRNEFSGGSGLIIQFPGILSRMYWTARGALIVALLSTGGLMLVIEKDRWILLWALFLLSSFFSKYYTAAPVMLASRGLGEISVWFAFGPMAVMVATVSQNVDFHPLILLAMPPTGISTLSILLLGQLIDYPADKEAGKWGVAVRWGPRAAALLYGALQIILVLNIIALTFYLPGPGKWILLCLIPYIFLLPGILSGIMSAHDDPAVLSPLAKKNVLLHLLFSGILGLGLLIYALLVIFVPAAI